MKRVFIAAFISLPLFSYELDSNLLSIEQNSLFDAQLQKSLKERDFNQLSWISPLNINLNRAWIKDYRFDKYNKQDSLNISINQPIFRFGGIYYGIKLSSSRYKLSKLQIESKRRELIATAVELLFNIKKLKLTISKLNLQVKNADIEIKSLKELYSAGLSDSITLDTAIAKKQEANIALLDAKARLKELKASFKKISSKDPESLKLPHLSLIDKDSFLKRDYNIKLAKANVLVANDSLNVTKAKYYPSIVAGASYTKILTNTPPSIPKKQLNYTLSINMPVSVNMFNDIEVAKYNRLISKLNSQIAKKNELIDYNLVKDRLDIIDKKIQFAKREAFVYSKLLNSSKALYKAGQKSKMDIELLENNVKIKRLDAKIYQIDKEIELLKLYKRVKQ